MVAVKRAGCGMIYAAMFDEVDEGTAIFKCSNDVPVGEGVTFLDLDELPSDHYLRLTGAGARMLRGEIPANKKMPKPGGHPGKLQWLALQQTTLRNDQSSPAGNTSGWPGRLA